MATYTYGNMQDRISSEIEESSHGNVSAAEVRSAIQSAIEHYETERFWFNEKTSSLTATASQAYVAEPSDFILLASPLRLTSSSITYELRPVSYDEYLSDAAVTTTTGKPTEFAYWMKRFYLYPTPNSGYTLPIHYTYRLTALSATSDSNEWTGEAERLIRERAKWDIYANLLKFQDLATVQKQIEMDEYSELLSHSTRRTTTGKLKASYL